MTTRGRFVVGGLFALAGLIGWAILAWAFSPVGRASVPLDPVLVNQCCPGAPISDQLLGLTPLDTQEHFGRGLRWSALVLLLGGALLLASRSRRALIAVGIGLVSFLAVETWFSHSEVDGLAPIVVIAAVALLYVALVAVLAVRDPQPPPRVGWLITFSGFTLPFVVLAEQTEPGFGAAFPPLVRTAVIGIPLLVLAAAVVVGLGTCANVTGRRMLVGGLFWLVALASFLLDASSGRVRPDEPESHLGLTLAQAAVIGATIVLRLDRAAVFVRWLSGFALATALVLTGEIVLLVIFSLVLYRGYSTLYLDLEQYPFQLLWGVFLAGVVGATSMLLRRQDIAYANQPEDVYHEEPLVEEVS